MTFIPTPEASTLTKSYKGDTDVSHVGNTYKFMGATVIGMNCNVGFNGTPSSMSLTLVEDVVNGDNFIEPSVPTLWAFSLPSGGVGAPILGSGLSLAPNGYYSTNLYFTGICTSWKKDLRRPSGKTITVNLVDPRELLGGVQCLLDGFALSQNFTGSNPRFSNINNVIDIFGYYDYGMTSDRNELGMTWEKVKTAIEAVKVKVNDIEFEFEYVGTPFTDAPSWYRIPDRQIDLLSLTQRVADDGGADFICVGRKHSSTQCVVEIRAIRRTNVNPLYQSEIIDFINDRDDIVEFAEIGKEYRNEYTSHIIVGGAKNANYIALPSEYNSDMHFTASGIPYYGRFPDDIKTRLFGGTYDVVNEFYDGDNVQSLSTSSEAFDVDSGSIFPFWGFPGSGTDYPLIEPFLSLDNLVLDYVSSGKLFLKNSLPQVLLNVKNFPVRERQHYRTFLDGDEDSDNRPFSYIETISTAKADIAGYTRGIPLNTEVLKAALSNETQFYLVYSLYYPDESKNMGFPYINWKKIPSSGISLKEVNLYDYIEWNGHMASGMASLSRDSNGNISEASLSAIDFATSADLLTYNFRNFIYQSVRQYAEEYMGKKFMVCLPKSNIMHRIWAGQTVPTDKERPIIEYHIDSAGFWETTPTELDGFQDPSGSSSFSSTEELEIRRRFMTEDGRFYPMVAIQYKPKGNCGFYANGETSIMLEDLSTSDFRPNRIADKNDIPPYVFVAPSTVSTLSAKRPDMAYLELPNRISYNPTRAIDFIDNIRPNYEDDEFLVNINGIVKHLLYHTTKNDDCRNLFNGKTKEDTLDIISTWAKRLYAYCDKVLSSDVEYVMDFKGIIIPLTSNWVTYGPWYATNAQAKGKVNIEVDDSLVPWNFSVMESGLNGLDELDKAGKERLERTISVLDYVDNATIGVAGFPEISLGSRLGYNSNLTGLSVNFGIDGVKTTYQFSTYSARAGTYRKSDYDNISRLRFDTKQTIVDPNNVNLMKLAGLYNENKR